MSLPFVIDIAIGLIFIYLTLSLLASEIQELIAVVLQWRAEHLKKSIEVLIAGGGDNTKRTKAREIANELYAHPLINNLHQEAQGGLSTLFRKLDRILFSLLRQLTGNANLFGQKASGPSYIPPQTFAAGLIEYLGIPAIARWITAARFEAFKQETLKQVICTIKENLDSFSEPSQKYIKRELNALALRFDSTLEDFIGEKIALPTSLDRMEIDLETYINTCNALISDEEPNKHVFMSQLAVQKNSLFGVIEKKVLLRKLKPSLEETIEVIRKTPEYYEEFEKAVKKLNNHDSAAYRNISRLLDRVPDSLKDSMSALAQKIRLSAEDTADDLQKLQMEVETWFDNAMARASGVYKRNARGIAILIGLMIATATNADTFHMVNRLSKDSVLRATVTQSAERLVSENPATVEEIRGINNEVNRVLEDFPLPIGWDQSNVQSQIEAERGWPLGYSKRALGWLISGIAISMGAAFWFNLLSKVVDIRAIGSTKSGKNSDNNSGRSPY